MLSRSMASLNTARRLNMQQYEIGITLLSQEAHTPESRSNTLAWTIRAYELALLSRVSLPTSCSISLPDFPLQMYLSFVLLRSLVRIYIYIYISWIHKHQIHAAFRTEYDLSLCRFSQCRARKWAIPVNILIEREREKGKQLVVGT